MWMLGDFEGWFCVGFCVWGMVVVVVVVVVGACVVGWSCGGLGWRSKWDVIVCLGCFAVRSINWTC